jgi:tetratricopeptide (TPR) repeat protein
MKKKSAPESQSWLEEAYPQMHYLLLAQDGDEAAGRWLEDNSRSVALLSRALSGQPAALSRLEAGAGVELDDLFELIDNEDLAAWLAERRPELHLLFEAAQGGAESLDRLKRKKPPFARLVGPLRRVHEAFLQRGRNGADLIEKERASDMSCLVGEMHLRQGEYERAVEAFSRAIENQPAADLYEGRARAYHALAGADEARARDLRER